MAEIAQIERHESWTRGGPVVSHMDDATIEALEERSAATVADPAPLGLWGFATGTWIIGAIFAGVFPTANFPLLAPTLLVFAGLAQFIAGLYAFRRTNALIATAFCSFGALYVLLATIFSLQGFGAVPTTGNVIVFEGMILVSFGFIALALAVAALRTNFAMVAVLGTLAFGYSLAGIPDLANQAGIGGWGIVGAIGGCFLIASAFFAYYTGMAMVVNSAWKQTVLPLGGEA